MAYSEDLAVRVRRALAIRADVTERMMFGGLAFMLRGNMCCGVSGDMLMLRLGKEGAADALKEPHVKPMDFTGKVLKSMVYVGPEGVATLEGLIRWVNRGADFAATLSPK
jgi:TfoX/Sxy family transcriptional regulator of competence genes